MPVLRRLVIVFSILVAAGLTMSAAPARAQTTWLDGTLTNWNRAGMAIPRAPAVNSSGNDSFCAGQQRPAETTEDRALTGAGWRLFNSYVSGWGVRIVGGQSDEDGMCRPTGYQYFVFVNGQFAGTVSPTPMDSRSDGSAGQVYLDSGGTMLRVDFARYSATDPLCCPSATTEVSYRITTGAGGPVLTPDTAYTMQNS